MPKLRTKIMLYRKHLILVAFEKDGLSVQEVADLFSLTRQYVYKVIRNK